MNMMLKTTPTMAEQIAQAAKAFQQQRTGHEPKSVSVVLSGDTLVVTLHGALSPPNRLWPKARKGLPRCRSFIGSYLETISIESDAVEASVP